MKPPTVSSSSPSLGAFVENICSKSTAQNMVIIACCSRTHFLQQLLAYVTPIHESSDALYGGDDIDRNPASHDNPQSMSATSHLSHKLQQPTLRILATSSHTKLVFCPNIPSFRAYISTLPVRLHTDTDLSFQPEKGLVQNRTQGPDVVILDMLSLHHGTSEFTVQGLSRTFAMLASVNASLPKPIRLVECIDVRDPEDSHRGSRLWKAEVPLLSGSVKIGEAGQAWAVRTIGIRKFAVRWFGFEEDQLKKQF